MAHPYESHRADKVAKSRASKFGYSCGGSAPKRFATGGKVSAPVKKAAGGEIKVVGRASGGRLDKFARGGKTKHKGTQVNIAVVQPHGGQSPAGMHPPGGNLPPPGGPPVPPPTARPPMPPPGAGGPGIPGMPPGGPMAGPMKPPGMMKRGGKVTGQKGGENGVGRLNKAKMYGSRPIKGS